MKLKDIPVRTKAEFCSMVSNWRHGMKYKGRDISDSDQQLLIQQGISKGWIPPATKTKLAVEEQIESGDKTLDLFIAEYYVMKCNTSKTRGIGFELTLSDFTRLVKKKTCYYSGQKLVLRQGDRNNLTLDRKDSTKGYTKENTVVCAWWVNQMKNELFEKPEGDIRTDMKTLMKILSKLS